MCSKDRTCSQIEHGISFLGNICKKYYRIRIGERSAVIDFKCMFDLCADWSSKSDARSPRDARAQIRPDDHLLPIFFEAGPGGFRKLCGH